jgi:carbamoyltransferase
MRPWLYRVRGSSLTVESLGPLFPLAGNAFARFCSYFEPFWRDASELSEDGMLQWRLEIAGKAMAYAALGVVERDAFKLFQKLLDDLDADPAEKGSLLGQQVVGRRDELFPGMSDADLIATFQGYLGELLQMVSRIAEFGSGAHLVMETTPSR